MNLFNFIFISPLCSSFYIVKTLKFFFSYVLSTKHTSHTQYMITHHSCYAYNFNKYNLNRFINEVKLSCKLFVKITFTNLDIEVFELYILTFNFFYQGYYHICHYCFYLDVLTYEYINFILTYKFSVKVALS